MSEREFMFTVFGFAAGWIGASVAAWWGFIRRARSPGGGRTP